MSWKHKKLGRIAEEMAEIDTLDGVLRYAKAVQEDTDAEPLKASGLTVQEWFWDTVRFIEERSTLPQIWRDCMPNPSSE